jgi:4-amino-4-deoxy-L-arabinose transferase-like glycosyltransferase
MNRDCRPNPARAGLLSCAGDEAQQAPLYYMALAAWQELGSLPAEPPPQQWPDQGFLLWLRFPNVVLGAATVVMAFLATRLIARDTWTPVIAAALVAFLPRFVFISAFVSNDNLVNFLGAVLTFCALRFSQRVTSGWMIATGAVFGLLITTKLSVLPLALIVPVLALLGPTWRRRLWLVMCGSLSALALSVWFLIQNWVRYGDPLALHASAVYLARIGGLGAFFGVPIPYVVTDPLHLVFVNVPKKIVTVFWYQSAWGRFHWSTPVGITITCFVVALLFGLIHQRISKRALLVLGAISVLSFACVWLLAFQTATYEPRYALVGLTAMATLVALALQRFPTAVRWTVPAAGLLGCLIAIHHDVLGVHWT